MQAARKRKIMIENKGEHNNNNNKKKEHEETIGAHSE